MISEEYLHLGQKEKVRSAHVGIRCMRYALPIAKEIKETTHYPEEVGRFLR